MQWTMPWASDNSIHFVTYLGKVGKCGSIKDASVRSPFWDPSCNVCGTGKVTHCTMCYKLLVASYLSNVSTVPQVTLSTDYLEVYENVSVINFAVDRSGDTSIPAVVHFKTINVAVDDETERPARGELKCFVNVQD